MGAPSWVVVGLGNPGPDYEGTRHNIGFRLLDRLARDLDAGPEEDRGDHRVARAALAGGRVTLVRPLTWMNRSGEALLGFAREEETPPERHLVVLDDAALPFGTLRFRVRGGAGGHRGLESVLESLGTEEVPRLRLGIGAAPEGDDLVEHVLDRFSEDEEQEIETWLERASAGVRAFLTEGPDAAMNRYNR